MQTTSYCFATLETDHRLSTLVQITDKVIAKKLKLPPTVISSLHCLHVKRALRV